MEQTLGEGCDGRGRLGGPQSCRKPALPLSKTYEAVIFDTKYGKQFDEVGSPEWEKAANPAALRGSAAIAYKLAFKAAVRVYYGTVPDPTGGAIVFHSLKHPPANWPTT